MLDNIPPVVKNLLIINVFFFAATKLLPQYELVDLLSMHYPFSPFFKPFQLITYMFMHADMGHIFFNMFGVFIFGSKLEQFWGSQRFLTFYLVTGLGALIMFYGVDMLLVHNMTGKINPNYAILHNGNILNTNDTQTLKSIYATPLLGASGALFGIMAGYALLFPNTELLLLFFPMPIKAKYLVGAYFVYEVYMSISIYNDNIAHLAHIGGAVIGFIMVRFVYNKDRRNFY